MEKGFPRESPEMCLKTRSRRSSERFWRGPSLCGCLAYFKAIVYVNVVFHVCSFATGRHNVYAYTNYAKYPWGAITK